MAGATLVLGEAKAVSPLDLATPDNEPKSRKCPGISSPRLLKFFEDQFNEKDFLSSPGSVKKDAWIVDWP